jgi:hypothetical protein
LKFLAVCAWMLKVAKVIHSCWPVRIQSPEKESFDFRIANDTPFRRVQIVFRKDVLWAPFMYIVPLRLGEPSIPWGFRSSRK